MTSVSFLIDQLFSPAPGGMGTYVRELVPALTRAEPSLDIRLFHSRFDEPMVEGNVIAVEPKFVFPGRGSVGIENMYAVTADGCEKMTTASEELIEA